MRFQAVYFPGVYQYLKFEGCSDQTFARSNCSDSSVVLMQSLAGHVGVLEKLQAVTLDVVYEVRLIAVGQLLESSPLYVEGMFLMVAANLVMMCSLFECAALFVTPPVGALDVSEVPLFAEGELLDYSPPYFEEMFAVTAANFVMCFGVRLTRKVMMLDVAKVVHLYAVG